MNMRPLLIITLALASALPLLAQATKPVPAKPAKPVTPAKPAVDKKLLDKAKQEFRNIKSLKDAEAAAKKAFKNNDAAKKEAERFDKEGLPSTEDAGAKLQRLKNSTSEDDIKELEALLKDNKPALEEELKKLKERARERMKKEGQPAPAPNPAPAPDPAPTGFDNVPAPTPLPLQKGPEFHPPPIKAERMIKGPSRDPKNPDRELPDSDPRTRTYVLTDNVTLRQPTMALDADEVDILFKAGQAPGSNDVMKEKPPGVDPIGRSRKEGSNIERIVARGRVRLMFVDKNGLVQVGRGDYITYEERTGWFTINGWPEVEFDGKLFRGPSKDSVIRLNRLEQADVRGCAFYFLDRALTADELPKTPEKPVPAAGPIRSDSSAPAPSPKPR